MEFLNDWYASPFFPSASNATPKRQCDWPTFLSEETASFKIFNRFGRLASQ